MEINEILKRENEFKYMLLERLRSDCRSFLSYGGRLWGITPQAHVETMLAIYNNLTIKPKWFTSRELKFLAETTLARQV